MSAAKKDGAKEKSSEQGLWNDEERMALLNHLIGLQGAAGDGQNFQPKHFASAADAVAPYYTIGAVKTAKHCRSQYSYVCAFLLVCNLANMQQQLKGIYSSIVHYQSLSGHSWDDKKGTNIIPELEIQRWNEYMVVKVL
jgi:hypothetical protein